MSLWLKLYLYKQPLRAGPISVLIMSSAALYHVPAQIALASAPFEFMDGWTIAAQENWLDAPVPAQPLLLADVGSWYRVEKHLLAEAGSVSKDGSPGSFESGYLLRPVLRYVKQAAGEPSESRSARRRCYQLTVLLPC